MKKNTSARKKSKRKSKHNIRGDVAPQGMFESIILSYKRSWYFIFVSVFLFWFLGSHLIEALTINSIPNIKVPTDVLFHKHPIWFIIIFFIKFAFWFGSCIYIYLFIKDLTTKKTA